MKQEKVKILSVRIPPELYDELREAARKDERTVSQQVRYLIQEHIRQSRKTGYTLDR